MSYKVTAPPTAEPLDLSFVKGYLKVEFDEDDKLIDTMIKGARSHCENYTGRVLMIQTVEKSFDCFPIDGMNCPLELEGAPVQSVESIKYLDVVGQETIWDKENYKVSVRQDITYITPKNNQSFPNTLNESDAVTIEYKVGYPKAEEVPGAFIQAMLLIIAKMYENREDTIKNLPSTSETLMSPYKIF